MKNPKSLDILKRNETNNEGKQTCKVALEKKKKLQSCRRKHYKAAKGHEKLRKTLKGNEK